MGSKVTKLVICLTYLLLWILYIPYIYIYTYIIFLGSENRTWGLWERGIGELGKSVRKGGRVYLERFWIGKCEELWGYYVCGCWFFFYLYVC